VWVKRSDSPPPATLYFSMKQLVELRATVAEAIIKANKHRMESR
jgi:hypothetical protein